MANDNLKDFTLNGVVAGILLTCLLAFAIGFMANNNPTGLGVNENSIFEESYINTSSYLYEIDEDSNILLNITSNTNPEISELGSGDSVSTSFISVNTAKNFWDSTKLLMSWVFTGTAGKMILGVFGGLFGFFIYFFTYKHIRGWV